LAGQKCMLTPLNKRACLARFTRINGSRRNLKAHDCAKSEFDFAKADRTQLLTKLLLTENAAYS
jgi:hypothetical protein